MNLHITQNNQKNYKNNKKIYKNEKTNLNQKNDSDNTEQHLTKYKTLHQISINDVKPISDQKLTIILRRNDTKRSLIQNLSRKITPFTL